MVLQENNDYPLIEFNRKFINLRKIFFKAKVSSEQKTKFNEYHCASGN